MDKLKRFSGRSLLWIVFITVLLVAALDYALYQGINLMTIKAGEAAAISEGIRFKDGLAQYMYLNPWFVKVFVPGTMAVGLLFSLFAWAAMRMVFKQSVTEETVAPLKKGQSKDAVKPAQIEENTQKRLFLHLISVLQKEGRLLDFFNEKLDQFDDAQIGSAVRKIHEDCSKTLSKYLALESVMPQNEGEIVTINAGFDPAEVKLTGKVVGDPPFKGLLRHKGWKTSKISIPTLSVQENPGVIAPAEVEIE
ncbi:MAG: DUF2760 domain-containing protein [Proteobacteria bacterium]|nr:DUF2760 domain-containing protein [Pseudomonadota bacterium]